VSSTDTTPTHANSNHKECASPHPGKILLLLLPYWSSLIPPPGISCIKGFLENHGYTVKTMDANVLIQFKEIYNNYLAMLKQYVPGKKGNFYNIAVDLLWRHMMAYLNYKDEREYIELVKLLAANVFFSDIKEHQVSRLGKLVAEFYKRLEKYVIEVLEQENPSVLGLSVYRDTAPASLFAFKLTKEKYPHIKTVMGGGIFSGLLDIQSPDFQFFLEKTPYIDKIIVGEGEKLFLKYLNGELPESQRVYTLNDITNDTLELDAAPVPDFSDFDLRYYPYLASYTSRGCPFNCAFCSENMMWGKFRKKTGKQVVEELTWLYKKHGNQLFLMGDSLLNPVINEVVREFLESDVSIYWDGYLRADKPVCNPELTFLWRRGGFYRARLGLESGSPRILKAMRKKIMPDQIKAAVSSLARAGIKTTTYWVIGYPSETKEDFQQTLNLIEELKDDIYEADCNPFVYYLTGQVNSNEWSKETKSIPLYSEEAKKMLIFQTWFLDCFPSPEETHQRMSQFLEFCRDIGVPNPYTLQEIYNADQRWKKLHPNAVPSIVEFQPNRDNRRPYIDENKYIKKVVLGKKIQVDEGGWGF
jgi:radical SAM superfamily enzyme YgiQ (UPF0313 family)